jgi:murein DD-endopeptidase MepM/ murein hydrolase activator NlpD
MAQKDDKTVKRTVRLIVCVAIFVTAAFMKLVFPGTLQVIGDKLNTAVNYKAALATLGEGISGKKNFVTALGEAFTYAFTGSQPTAETHTPPASETHTQSAEEPKVKPDTESAPAQTSADGFANPESTAALNAANNKDAQTAAAGASKTDSDMVSASPAGNDAVQTFTEASPPAAPGTVGEAIQENADFSNAVVAAFLEDQEQYSDYSIPAGVSFGMPKISVDYKAPVKGVVSSSFGYRVHPVNKTVKFHFGTDIDAKKGAPITAFADGKVISAGESKTLGNYVILKHGGVESEYAHCGKIVVTSGQAVKKGDRIATVGDTGNATESCLHFELRVSGVCVNSEYYIQWS